MLHHPDNDLLLILCLYRTFQGNWKCKSDPFQILVKWYLNLWFRDPPFTPDTSQKVPRTVDTCRYVIKVSLEDKSD